MSLCKYAYALGKTGKGIHSIRLFNIAIVDVLVTVLIAYIISKKIKKKFSIVLVILFLIGIVLHKLFCVKTKIL